MLIFPHILSRTDILPQFRQDFPYWSLFSGRGALVQGSGEKIDVKVHSSPKNKWHGIWDFGPQDYAEPKFTDHITATWVADQLRKESEKPFLLACGFIVRMYHFFPPRRVYDSFKDVKLPQVAEDDWDDIPDAAHKVSMSNFKIPVHDWMEQRTVGH